VVMREYFTSGEVLPPPRALDRGDYDSRGGAWVSLRSRNDIFDRHAREGFWHLPGETSWGVTEDIVRAAFRTACSLTERADRADLLESSHVAVTLFSALESVPPGGLDNDRYGIVVASRERPEIMGGALPRMPGIRDEWQQFRHARYNNAELYPFEEYTIYRHEVAKFVEPGASWQPSGVPGRDESPDLSALAARGREIALGAGPTTPLADIALPPSASQIFVTVYAGGRIRGCMGSEIGDLSVDLRELTLAALADDRFDETDADNAEIAVSVSLLYNELRMDSIRLRDVAGR
jgi:hypothetical protein